MVIRVNPSPDDHLVGRCVVRDEQWLVAAPSIPRPAVTAGAATELPALVRTTPGRGALTGKYLDRSAQGRISGERAGHYAMYRDERTADIARTVVECAMEMDCAPGALAIAWLLARSPLIVPILGARDAEQLKTTLDGIDLSIPDEVSARLEQASALPLNYPYDFLRENQGRMFKDMYAEMDPRRARPF